MAKEVTVTEELAAKSYAAQRVTLVGAVLDALLGLAKVTVGYLANSHALIADGIHSFSDLLTDALVVVIARVAHREPDRNHPYGHGRFETLGTVILGATLIAVASALAYDSLLRLLTQAALAIPGWPALAVAGLSIVAKEWIYRYTMRVAERLNSDLLRANAWHSRSDALSSIVVLIGVGGAMAGLPWLDMAAAIVVAIMVAKIGWELAWNSIQELVDTALEPAQVEAIRRCVLGVAGVKGVHSVRSRKMGAETILDLHIQVSPHVSVSEGHQIGEWATQRLQQAFAHVRDVTYHIDAEDDKDLEVGTQDQLLPLRHEVMEKLRESWEDLPEYAHFSHITLHYLAARIEVEVYLPASAMPQDLPSLTNLQRRLEAKVAHLPWIGSVSVWYGRTETLERPQ